MRIVELCQRYGVHKLEIFESAARSIFDLHDSLKSELGLPVEFVVGPETETSYLAEQINEARK